MWNPPVTKDEAVERIARLKAEIESLTKYLPYADHGAYGQDRNRIASNQGDINTLKKLWGIVV